MEKHHIAFKSQGGLDFELNYKYLSSEDHRGNLGPHLNKKTDDYYKRELEAKLREVLVEKYYTIDELIDILGLNNRQANKAFKRVTQTSRGIAREDVIKRIMGDRYYL